MEKTLPVILQWDESFDVGSYTLTGVNDADYKPPFRLTAKLNKFTIKVDRPQLSPADIRRLETAKRRRLTDRTVVCTAMSGCWPHSSAKEASLSPKPSMSSSAVKAR